MSDPEVPPARPPRAGLSPRAVPTPASDAVPPTVGPAVVSAAGTASANAPGAAPVNPPAKRGGIRRCWIIGAAVLLVLAAAVVLVARFLVTLPHVRDFMTSYPGIVEVPGAATGFPAWVSWQHFLNAFFLVLIVKTGWQVRTQSRPPATWTSATTRAGATPIRISLTLWLHLALDALWLLNGVVFVVVLIASGRWTRVVPTSWDIVPNALSAGLQYASLDWPTENGWTGYNSLQVIAYFVTIFVAAPLAVLSGIRMSPLWPKRWSRGYPVAVARAVHLPVMFYFVLFTIVHVTLVLATGALRNLNHMYAGRDVSDLVGALVFAGSLVVMAGAWAAARPVVVAPLAALTGRVTSR